MRASPAALALALAVLLGCGHGMSRSEREEMDTQVGRMTYKEALARFGAPDSAEDQEGDILVTVWRYQELHTTDTGSIGAQFCDGQFTDQASVGSPGQAPGEVTVETGWERTLVFDRTTRLLKSWKYRSW